MTKDIILLTNSLKTTNMKLTKMKHSSLLLFILILCSNITAQISQSYFVYIDNGKTVVRGQIDNRIVFTDTDASKAINKAIELLDKNNGGELKLSNGVYSINSPVYLKNNVNIIGSGNSTVLKMDSPNKEGSIIIAKKVEDVKIADLSLQGVQRVKQSTGIIFDQVGMGKIEGVYARDFGEYGIWLRDDCFMCEVNSCQTSGNGSAGVYLYQNNFSGRGGDSVPNLITNCKSYGEDGHAFELERSTCINLVGNIVYQCLGHGFYIHEHSCSNLITGCRVFSSFKNAVYADGAHEINITGNIFCWSKGNGIEIANTVWGTISGNNVIDNGDVVNYGKDGWNTGHSYGIFIHSKTRSFQVSGNAIFNWPDGHPPMIDGIYESEDCQFNNITNNNVQFYTGSPVNVNGENSVEVDNMGNPEFYEKFWGKEKVVEKQLAPYQGVLKPLDRERVDSYLEKTK